MIPLDAPHPRIIFVGEPYHTPVRPQLKAAGFAWRKWAGGWVSERTPERECVAIAIFEASDLCKRIEGRA